MASHLCILVVAVCIGAAAAGHDYGEALSKSILYYEAQRSGVLPCNQRANWRADSGLHDGKANGIDLVGGYYDAGDNVKFGFPMAFTITMLSWSVIEYGNQMASIGELNHAMEAIKWGTDYLLKAHPEPDVLYGEVGDGDTDHDCWQRPEDMTTPRQAYRIDADHPGSDLAGETAAAMAAASMVFFRHSNLAYSNELLNHAKQLFIFADKYRGEYNGSITVARNFYGSQGYADELLWAATWLYEATGDLFYMNYLVDNAGPLGGTGWATTEFSWDVKYVGVQILASKFLVQRRGGNQSEEVLKRYQDKAEFFLCGCLQKGNQNVQRTRGGLLYWQKWNNMQFVTSASFLLAVYFDYLTSAGKGLQCPEGFVQPSELLAFAKSQIDYLLGDNPRNTSYMVGYGRRYPRHVHHRASSIISYKVDSKFVSCEGGFSTWFSSNRSNPNVLVGAIVGGPNQNDNFSDKRDNYVQAEPTTLTNGPVIGVLARLHHSFNHPPPDNSPLGLSQTVTSSWSYQGQTYYRYSTLITNKSKQTVKNLELSIDGLCGPIWGLTKINDSLYTYPKWLQSLSPGQSFDFVYIQPAPQATISVYSYDLCVN